ncbi:MAG: hypothetical protein JWM91_330 [Rhodospirillales bacterium]|nr:hypothetical protein [Rhodospirillales bacterium]
MRTFKSIVSFAKSKIFHHHVFFEFPIPVLAERRRHLPILAEGYELRVPETDVDCEAWARLISEDPGFGAWTAGRVRSELMAHLIDSRAASLILYRGEAVGCACVIDASTATRRIAHLMYLYVRPSHRGKSLGVVLTYETLGICVDRGYHKVIAVTDPPRLSALLMYLSNGCRPIRNSLYSYVQWFRITQRLAPALDSMRGAVPLGA